MTDYEAKGKNIKSESKTLILDFMKDTINCHVNGEGMKLAEIFRKCGFDWGTYENATSSNQQYWVVALMRELEYEGLVKRDPETKKWKLSK